MQMCTEHWNMCRKAVADRGMDGLVAGSGEEAADNVVEARFDPLMSLNWHFTADAMRCGGLYLMADDPSGANGGHYCPICEFVKNAKDYDPEWHIGNIADQLRAHARAEGLLVEQ
jgi:hypothetical protein